MILDFPVRIERKTVGVSERGFGTILIYDTTQDLEFRYITADSLNDLDIDSQLYKIASRLFMQTPVPQEVAIVGKLIGVEKTAAEGLQEVLNENSDWFFLTCTDNDAETVVALSELIAANNKMYFVTVNDITDAEALYEEVFTNTAVYYHDDVDSYVAEGLAVIMSYNVGGKTAKFKQVVGVKNSNVTLTQLNTLHDNNLNGYVEKMGVLQTSEGKVLSGEYIDVILGELWVRFRMEEAVNRLAFTQDKIPYTDLGIGMLVGEVEKTLARAVDQGIVEEGQYKIEYLPRELVPTNDVALRKYDYIRWTAMLQGAIHQGQIFGVLTYDMVNELGGNE